MKYLIFGLTFSFLASCSSPTDNHSGEYSKTELFRQYIKKFRPIDLPFVFRESEVSSHDIESMAKFNGKSDDTLFLKTDYPDETHCFGVLKDTSKFYSLIYFFPADSYYPVLATYTKDGQLISKEGLIVNGCGGDCGLKSCSENGIINSDYSIFTSDTLVWDFFCDSLGEPIPNSAAIWVDKQVGKISKSGKITMDKKTHTVTNKNSL